VVMVVTKFAEGGWLVVLVAPAVVFLLLRIRGHYDRVGEEIERPLTFRQRSHPRLRVVVPVERWNLPAEKALAFACELSDDVVAVHVALTEVEGQRLQDVWGLKVEAPAERAGIRAPRLQIVHSEYRQVHEPIVRFVRRMQEEEPDVVVMVVIPDLTERTWLQTLLHNAYGIGFKTALYQASGERSVVAYVPWHLRDGRERSA
jgi:hypothetical protein